MTKTVNTMNQPVMQDLSGHSGDASKKKRLNKLHVFLVARRIDQGIGGGQARFASLLERASDEEIKIDVSGLPHRSNRTWLGRVFWSVRIVLEIVRKRSAGTRIFHIFSGATRGTYIEKAVFGIVAKSVGGRVIFNFRNDYPNLHDKLSSFEKRLSLLFLSRVDVVLVQYTAAAHYLKQCLGETGPRIHVIGNGLDPEWRTSIDQKYRGVGDGQCRVIFLGSIGTRKGVYELIEACARIRDRGRKRFSVDIFGNAEKFEDMDRLRELIAKRNLDGTVRSYGWVTGKERIESVRRGEIYVLPSYAEGFPNALIEAMACGLAVVATRVGAIPEIVEHGKNGFLIKPGNVEELTERIDSLICDQKQRHEFGAYARRCVLERWTFEKCKQNYWNLYKEIATIP